LQANYRVSLSNAICERQQWCCVGGYRRNPGSHSWRIGLARHGEGPTGTATAETLASGRRRREIVTAENLFLLALFACGAFAGLLSRWGPLSGWAALALPLLLPPLRIGLTLWFC